MRKRRTKEEIKVKEGRETKDKIREKEEIESKEVKRRVGKVKLNQILIYKRKHTSLVLYRKDKDNILTHKKVGRGTESIRILIVNHQRSKLLIKHKVDRDCHKG